MIRHIVFDLGNVLIEWNAERVLANASNDLAVQDVLRSAIFESGLWQALDAGAYSLEETQAAVLERLGGRYAAEVEAIMWHWYEGVQVFDETQALGIRLAEKGYAVYILSNTSPLYYHLVEAGVLPLHEVLSGHYLSCESRLMKPDVAIYQDFCDRFELDPRECVFIDDIPANIAAAKAIGMAGIVAKGHESIVAGLAVLGIAG